MEPLPIDLSPLISISDAVLERICAANQDLHVERNAHGQLEIMAPAGGRTSNRNSRIVAALFNWNDAHGGGYVFGPDAGFYLPSGAMRAPDAAWVAAERWERLPDDLRAGFPPLCPDFVVELRSRTERLVRLQAKMEEWIANGCRRGWLIDPQEATAHVYCPDGAPTAVGFDEPLSGGDVLTGFTLDLDRLR